jgi:hypothetical protein
LAGRAERVGVVILYHFTDLDGYRGIDRDGWDMAVKWLKRETERVEFFEDRASIVERAPVLPQVA